MTLRQCSYIEGHKERLSGVLIRALPPSLSAACFPPGRQVPLPRWPHSRDTLTVWKRHAFCAIHYDDDSEEEDDGESQDGEDEEGKGDEKKGASGKGQARETEQEDSDSVSSAGSSASAAAKGAKTAGRKDAKGSRSGGQGGADGSESNGEASDGEASDDFGSEEGFPIGMPDLDMYAFLPTDEQMSCAQAAPCVQFLLGAQK